MWIVDAANEDCSLLIFLSVCEDIKWPSHSPDASLAGGIHTAHLSLDGEVMEKICIFVCLEQHLWGLTFTQMSASSWERSY